jgi:16S rRNA G966 N2-methylase RsmD
VAAGAAVNKETIMDSLNSNGSGALALEALCQGAAQELLMRSYTIRTVNRYKRVWEQLADFARSPRVRILVAPIEPRTRGR